MTLHVSSCAHTIQHLLSLTGGWGGTVCTAVPGTRERERERHTERDTERDRDRDRQRQRERQRERGTETESLTDRQRRKQRDRERETDRQTDREFRRWGMVEDVRTAIPGTVKILNSRRVGGGGRDTLRYWFNRETEFRSTPFPPGHNYDTHTHLTELTAPLLPFRTPTVHRPLFPGGKRIPHCQCMMTLLMTCLPSWWPWKLVTEGGRD